LKNLSDSLAWLLFEGIAVVKALSNRGVRPKVLDRLLPGILLTRGTAVADESLRMLAIVYGRLLNRVVIEQVSVATEKL
jgi:hypothetical protein